MARTATPTDYCLAEIYADLGDLLADTAAATTTDPELDEAGDPRIGVDDVFDREAIVAAAYVRDPGTGRYRMSVADADLFDVCLAYAW